MARVELCWHNGAHELWVPPIAVYGSGAVHLNHGSSGPGMVWQVLEVLGTLLGTLRRSPGGVRTGMYRSALT